MELKQLRASVTSVLRDVTIPDPFDLERFRLALQEQRGREIALMPIPTPGTGPCGLWLPTNDCDYVLYEANTSPPHQVHIALHELGHLIFDHDGISPYSEEFLRRALPNLDPAAVRRVLSRGAYSVQQEAEAELLATMIGERGITAVTANIGHPADVSAQLERLNDALGAPSPKL